MKKVHLEQAVRKFGNSSGVIIPASIMRELDIDISDVVEIDITPKKKKPKFDIDELMENTDFESQRQNEELKEWNDLSSEGREIV